MTKKSIRVAIFEDNHKLRESLSLMIENAEGLLLVGAFPNGNDLENCIAMSSPDVVLMDIEMPGLNGIDAVTIIKKKYPEIQVLMQTIFQDDDSIFRAVCAGASGYLLKNSSLEQYVNAVEDVHEGAAPMSGIVARKVLELFNRHIPRIAENDYQLTPRESEILALLAKGKSYKQIAAELGLAFETVRSHMKRIYTKLHVNSNTEAVLKAINEKLV